jgi:nucleotide-binding universal stress UspA family protein
MYTRLLVPLDTSDLAEQALPHAEALARCFRAELELVTVIHVAGDEVPEEGDALDEYDPRRLEVQEYLDGLAGRLKEDGLSVSAVIRHGDVAEEIILHATDARCDLIVICTHGRSGLGRWVYGSVADRVLRYSPVPVLLVRATKT